MAIEKNFKYKIKGNSEYFKRKYGTPNPTILIEDKQINVTGKSWMCDEGNPACICYALRINDENIPVDNNVYYGHIETKIGSFGELVHESELEGE
jgi:hypothetical protein